MKDALKICVIVVSSTGDGDSPENGDKFFRYLRNSANSSNTNGLLSHVFYAMLGLGDSNYSKF